MNLNPGSCSDSATNSPCGEQMEGAGVPDLGWDLDVDAFLDE